MDRGCKWNCHVDEICSKINQYVYVLKRLSTICDLKTSLTAYHAYVSSILRYNVMFWGNSSEKETVFRAQKRCLRAMCGLNMTESCKDTFIKLGLLTFPCIYIFEISMFIRNNMNFFEIQSQPQKTLRPRPRHQLMTLTANKMLLHKNIFGMAPTIYNKLPESLKDMKTSIFKIKLKRFLVNKSYYCINDYLNDDIHTI